MAVKMLVQILAKWRQSRVCRVLKKTVRLLRVISSTYELILLIRTWTMGKTVVTTGLKVAIVECL